ASRSGYYLRSSCSGVGWFPGYAIDLETGERLNIAYGENSYWGGEIGRDMIWNPNDQLITSNGSPYFGGCHWIYVFKNDRRQATNADRVPKYDEGAYIMATLPAPGVQSRLKVFRGVAWVGGAVVATGQQLLASDVRINLSVAKPYRTYVNYNGQPEPIDPERNNGLPLYTFGTGEYATQTGVASVANEFLDRINVVPNPYYAFSGYETSRLDNRVKFINLPQTCTISIYTVSGTLVRKYRKDNDLTYLDWDLKNASNIPIAGGVYICHIDVPGVGEKVLKWFGAMRPIDLQNF
ncbi:MAG: T9SS C-terminal target domain-containing protein, partial [Flavobacteriales bacterium]